MLQQPPSCHPRAYRAVIVSMSARSTASRMRASARRSASELYRRKSPFCGSCIGASTQLPLGYHRPSAQGPHGVGRGASSHWSGHPLCQASARARQPRPSPSVRPMGTHGRSAPQSVAARPSCRPRAPLHGVPPQGPARQSSSRRRPLTGAAGIVASSGLRGGRCGMWGWRLGCRSCCLVPLAGCAVRYSGCSSGYVSGQRSGWPTSRGAALHNKALNQTGFQASLSSRLVSWVVRRHVSCGKGHLTGARTGGRAFEGRAKALPRLNGFS